jgi:hypothetical protein
LRRCKNTNKTERRKSFETYGKIPPTPVGIPLRTEEMTRQCGQNDDGNTQAILRFVRTGPKALTTRLMTMVVMCVYQQQPLREPDAALDTLKRLYYQSTTINFCHYKEDLGLVSDFVIDTSLFD